MDFALALDAPAEVKPVAQPAPTPPRATRPLRLSVTAIEDWLRDPYTIYARYILNLQPLDPVDMPLSAADRGSAIHNALGDFTKAYATTLPADPVAALREVGEKHFKPLMQRPEARALWWPRFQRIVKWFAEWEAARRGAIAAIEAEIKGEISIHLDNARTFVLSARADRIERRADGSFAILDYKTGQPPTAKQVRMGLSPQLTLEAAILRGGGFKGYRCGLIRRRARLCPHQRQQPAGRVPRAAAEDQERGRAAAGRGRRLRAQAAGSADPHIRERKRAVSLAEPADVDQPLRQL